MCSADLLGATAVTVTVKWFNATKGFRFIRPGGKEDTPISKPTKRDGSARAPTARTAV